MDASMSINVTPVVSVALVVVSTIFPVLSLLSIILRFQARRIGRLKLAADDWWILAGWLPTFGLSLTIWIFGSITGIAKYKVNLAAGIQRSFQCIFICSAILQVSLSAVKISILLFYKRTFSVPKFQIAIYTAIAIVGCWGIAFFLLILLEGEPISRAWTGKGHFRFDQVAMEFAQSATSIALNVAVLLLPLPMLWYLPMSPHRVWDLILVYVLGALAYANHSCCAAAIVRLVLLHASIAKEATDLSVVHIHTNQLIFMIIETNCSIIAACLPCYGALLRGGQSLASIVRSLAIHGRADSQTDSSFTSLRSGKHYPIHGIRDLYAETGSQVELTGPRDRWSRTTTQVTIKVSGNARQNDECLSPGIVVHTELDISTKGTDV
ncbi:hypothetical protein ABOM_001554 [Aspergillus bombycis]|uniref:Rhodopsin domain-containing protein n=1 Tax=Aspergillus bombycis TaxID=109264 RepID=A0A1F8AEK8_9EURO|nr:hypothetical protein ABOM_001554 [Aspergillus bombycis]OGM49785.1 hypothetical protein ABOM_001554 [Aspergillus bombycis]